MPRRIFELTDEYTYCFRRCFKARNQSVCVLLAIIQLLNVCVAFAQHLYSLLKTGEIFACSFLPNNTAAEPFLAADVIVFDYGLLKRAIGVDECVANHLDGGYMRAVLCIFYIISLVIFLVAVQCLRRPSPCLIKPVLTVQTTYMLGLVVLTLALITRLLSILLDSLTLQATMAVLIYVLGVSLNLEFTVTLWHYFWYLEGEENQSMEQLIYL